MPSIISSDVATSLPNVPTTRRQAVADACNNTAIGQSYAGSDVLATLATFGWWYPLTEPTAAFSDAAGTVACANGDGIQVQKSWITQNDLAQSTASRRPIFNSATGAAFTKSSSTSLEIANSLISGTSFSVFIIGAPTKRLTGGFLAKIGNTSSGFGLGVGDAGSLDGIENFLDGLREAIAHRPTSYLLGLRNKVIAYSTNNNAGVYYDNGVAVASFTGQSINTPSGNFSVGGSNGSRCIDATMYSILVGSSDLLASTVNQASRFLRFFHAFGMPTYSSGADTVTLNGSEASPCYLDDIVAAVGNTAKANKTGGYTYNFSFAVLNGSNGFIRFDPDTFTNFTDTRFEKNGSTGGMIFRERSVVKHEGPTSFTDAGPVGAYTGYKIIAYRDVEGSNPRLIQAAFGRCDILSANVLSVNTPTFVITGLDVETIGLNGSVDVSASLKIYTSATSSISNLRILSRDTKGCEFQAQLGLFSDLTLEGAALSTSPTAAQTITLVRPVFNFKGLASSLSFNFNNTATVEIQDPIFPNGAWNGNYTGVTSGFRFNVNCLVNVSYSSKLIFLNGSIPRQLKVRHTRNDATNIDLVADGSGSVSQLLLTSTRNGSSLSVGTLPASTTYTWTITARKYDYAVAADTDILYSAQSFSVSSSLFIQVSLVPFLSLSESAAAALTGISLAASGSTSGLATISIARTAVQLWQYYRQFIATYSNFGSIDSWIYDGATLDLGAWNITITAALTGKIKSAGTITLGAGGSVTSATTAATAIVIVQPGNTDLRTWTFASGTVINVSSSTAIVTVAATEIANITAGTGVTIQSPQVSISIVTTIGASVSVRAASNNVLIASGTADGSGNFTASYSGSGVSAILRVRKAGFIPIQNTVAITSAGLNASAVLSADGNYNPTY